MRNNFVIINSCKQKTFRISKVEVVSFHNFLKSLVLPMCVNSFFSFIKSTKTPQRTRLTDQHLSSLIKGTFQPDIPKLASKKRCQGERQNTKNDWVQTKVRFSTCCNSCNYLSKCKCLLTFNITKSSNSLSLILVRHLIEMAWSLPWVSAEVFYRKL